jgi:hypothetical protein
MTEAEKKDVDEVRGTPSTDPDHLLAPRFGFGFKKHPSLDSSHGSNQNPSHPPS